MARRIDVKLQESWRRRLAGFRPDRETVSKFCRRAGISVAGYYYWRRRLAAAAGETARQQSPRLKSESFVELAVGVSGTVAVELPSGVRIRVPVRSTDALVTAIRTAAEVSREVPAC
jgi:hypothetical protein